MGKKFKKPSRAEAVYNIKFFLLLNLGLIFTAVGISVFKTPNHLAFGGTSGISIILSTVFPRLDVGGAMWIVNALLVVLGVIFLNIRYMGRSAKSCYRLKSRLPTSAFWSFALR